MEDTHSEYPDATMHTFILLFAVSVSTYQANDSLCVTALVDTIALIDTLGHIYWSNPLVNDHEMPQSHFNPTAACTGSGGPEGVP